MNVLLMGIGNWGSRVVNDFCYANKETRKTKLEIIRFGTWDILSWKMVVSLTASSFWVEYVITTFLFPFIITDHFHESVLSGYYVFLIVLLIINTIVMWLVRSDRLVRTRFNITENDQIIFKRIKRIIKKEEFFEVDRESEKTINKYVRLQRAVLPTSILVGFFIGTIAAVYFHRTIAITEILRQYIINVLSRFMNPYISEMVTKYFILAMGIPVLLGSTLKNVIMPFYMPTPIHIELPTSGSIMVKRENVSGYGFVLYEEEFPYITMNRVSEEDDASLSYVLQDEIEKVITYEITEEGRAFDAIVFFGEVGSRLTEEFALICNSLRAKYSESIWFYLRIPKNFISERQHQLLLRLIRSAEGTLFEEETAPLFKFHPLNERDLRIRMLERLFAVGEIDWEKSIKGLDTGNIKFFLNTRMLTSLGWGYVATVPENADKDYRLLSDLYHVTVENCTAFDMNYKKAGAALATVKRESPWHDEVAIHDYDTIKDFLWERYGKFIQVFDIEYLQMEPYKVKESYLEMMKFTFLNPEGNPITYPATLEERKKVEEHRSTLSRLEEVKMAHTREEIMSESELLEWSIAVMNHKKRVFLDRLRYRNLMVDDVKEKELFVLFGRIDPEEVLGKYLASTRFDREFHEGIQHGVILDPSVLYNGSDESLTFLCNEYKDMGIGNLYMAPSVRQESAEKLSELLEFFIADTDERMVCAKKIVHALETYPRLDSILEKSEEITSKCEIFIHELMVYLADGFDVNEDHPGLRLIAEEIWLVYSEKGYIMGWGTDTRPPEISEVIQRICERYDIVGFDMSEDLRSIVEKWEVVQSDLISVDELYLNQIKLRYKTIEDKRPIIDLVRYFGGGYGRKGNDRGGNGEGGIAGDKE